MGGRSFVDLEALARVLNGSLSFHGDQVVLSLPPQEGSAPPAAAYDQTSDAGFSKEFLRAAIEEMTTIREWRSALLSAVENSIPVTAEFMANYRGPAATNLRLAGVAATTESDRNAAQLIKHVFEMMSKLSDQVVTARKNLNYIAPDSLQNDPLDHAILNCARSLSAMAANGRFDDDGVCR